MVGRVLSHRPLGTGSAIRALAGIAVGALTTAVLATAPSPLAAAPGTPSIEGLHVSGNQILNKDGQPIQLLGVNRAGSEYACIQNFGFFDGPSDDTSVKAIAGWNTNTVRVPLNESCWLNINGAPAQFSGDVYRKAIADYVDVLNQNGLVPMLELHWSAPGSMPATGQTPMPNLDHTVDFWRSVAETFKDNSTVIFDLFNEPFPDNNRDTDEGWRCWRDGGTCAGVDFQVAGMQLLVDTVRSTGATNVIMLGGIQFSNALSQFLTFKPTDPLDNLVAAWHVYNFNVCNNAECFQRTAAPVAAALPLVAGEIGENDCQHGFIDGLMNFLDQNRAGYLGWTWNANYDCGKGPALIVDYDGTPTEFGKGLMERLAERKIQPLF